MVTKLRKIVNFGWKWSNEMEIFDIVNFGWTWFSDVRSGVLRSARVGTVGGRGVRTYVHEFQIVECRIRPNDCLELAALKSKRVILAE